MNLLLIFLGGGLGAIARYLITNLMHQQSELWPWGILLVNVLGTLILGYIYYGFKGNTFTQTFITIGFLGSLTTFSTFALDAYLLITQKQYTQAIFFILCNLFISMLLIALFHQLWQNTKVT